MPPFRNIMLIRACGKPTPTLQIFSRSWVLGLLSGGTETLIQII